MYFKKVLKGNIRIKLVQYALQDRSSTSSEYTLYLQTDEHNFQLYITCDRVYQQVLLGCVLYS